MFSNRDMQLRKIIETLVLITGMALLCQSCKDRELKEYDFPNCYEIDLNSQQPELPLSQFVDSVAEIVLTFPEDDFIGRASQIWFAEDCFFILDRMQHVIFRFLNDGKCVGKLKQRGNGKGEYSSISSFFVCEKEIFVFDKAVQCLLVYDFSFQYIRKIHCSQWVESVYPLDDGFICFTPHYVRNAPNGIWLMDEQGNPIKELYNHGKKYPVPSVEWSSFYKTKHGIGIFDMATNSFYNYTDNNELLPIARWDVGQKTIFDYEGEESVMKVNDLCWFAPIFVDTPLWTWYIWTNLNETPSTLYTAYSKREGRNYISTKLKMDMGRVNILGFPLVANVENVLVALNTDEYLSEEEKDGLPEHADILSIYCFKE